MIKKTESFNVPPKKRKLTDGSFDPFLGLAGTIKTSTPLNNICDNQDNYAEINAPITFLNNSRTQQFNNENSSEGMEEYEIHDQNDEYKLSYMRKKRAVIKITSEEMDIDSQEPTRIENGDRSIM